jgi:hypothetical protein
VNSNVSALTMGWRSIVGPSSGQIWDRTSLACASVSYVFPQVRPVTSAMGIASVPRFVGLGERRPRDTSANAHVIELGLHRAETRLDIAQAFTIGELREGHAQDLVSAGEA